MKTLYERCIAAARSLAIEKYKKTLGIDPGTLHQKIIVEQPLFKAYFSFYKKAIRKIVARKLKGPIDKLP